MRSDDVPEEWIPIEELARTTGTEVEYVAAAARLYGESQTTDDGHVLIRRNSVAFFVQATPGPLVELFDLEEPGLIIECRSGVRYTNQTRGTTCDHPSIEGIFVPLRLASQPLGHHEFCSVPGGGFLQGITIESADFVDGLLREAHLDHLRVDRERLHESHEAWVFLRVGDVPDRRYLNQQWHPDERVSKYYGVLYGFRGATAVLTWDNSD